jgi:hypothetical protein
MPINLINDDYGIAFELSLFTINIKKKNCGGLESLKKKRRYEKRKSHNMLYLMLNLIFKRLKKLCLVYSFIGCEKG